MSSSLFVAKMGYLLRDGYRVSTDVKLEKLKQWPSTRNSTLTKIARSTWQNVRDTIHERILNSTYAPGDKLPKDETIAEELGCARTTVQRAMRELSESGLVERKRKGGTNVRSDPVTRATLDISITRKEIEKKGNAYSHHLLSQNKVLSPINIAANFELPKQLEMLRVEAIHLANSRPYTYEDRWISIDTIPEILDVDFTLQSANEWLVRNKPYNRCVIRFYAERAGNYYGKLFKCDVNEALFVIERTTWLNDQPITSVKAVSQPGYSLTTTT